MVLQYLLAFEDEGHIVELLARGLRLADWTLHTRRRKQSKFPRLLCLLLRLTLLHYSG